MLTLRRTIGEYAGPRRRRIRARFSENSHECCSCEFILDLSHYSGIPNSDYAGVRAIDDDRSDTLRVSCLKGIAGTFFRKEEV
jgi:hypothetical protein